jgi:hypothetical protein
VPSRTEKSARRAWAAVQDACEELSPSAIAAAVCQINIPAATDFASLLRAAMRATARENQERSRLEASREADERPDDGPDEDDHDYC